MTAFTLNIHEFYSDLKEAGFTEKQADVIAKIQGKSATATIEQVKSDLHLDDIATKRDLKDLELRIVTLLSAMQQDIQATKMDIQFTKWTNKSILILLGIITSALVKIAFFTSH